MTIAPEPGTDLDRNFWLVPMIVLLVGLLPLPYGFYIVLRIVVFGAALAIAWKAYELNNSKFNTATWVFGLLALLYNPIVPVHLTKVVWMILNAGSAALFWLPLKKSSATRS